MITITKAQYAEIHPDYKSVWEDIYGEHPEWKGRRSCFLGCIKKDGGTQLAIEGVNFEIKEHWQDRAHRNKPQERHL